MREGWKRLKLVEACDEIFAGGDVPKSQFSDTRTKDYSIPIFTNGEKNKGFYGYTKLARVTRPSITISARGTIGYSEIRHESFYPAIRLIVLTPNENLLDLTFLHYALRSIDFTHSGTSIPQLTVPMVKEVIISVPPLSEQKCIVAILDEAFAAIDKAKVNTEKNLQNAKELFESYLNKVFEEKGEGWEEIILSKITTVKDGTHDSPKYVTEGIPFVTQKNIREDGLSLDDTKFISQSDHDKFYKRSNVAFGDILISMIGANRGMACIVDKKQLFSIKNVGLIKDTGSINQKFLLYFLKSRISKEFVRQASNGGAQEFVGLTALRNFPITVAPQIEQDRIVTSLDKILSASKNLENIYERKLEGLDELKKTILQKAFSGELTSAELAQV